MKEMMPKPSDWANLPLWLRHHLRGGRVEWPRKRGKHQMIADWLAYAEQAKAPVPKAGLP